MRRSARMAIHRTNAVRSSTSRRTGASNQKCSVRLVISPRKRYMNMPRQPKKIADEPGARRRLDRGEHLAFRADLNTELAGVGLLAFTSRTGMLHDEARHPTSGSQVHLQEQGRILSAPPVGLPSRDAAVHGLLRPLILPANAGGSEFRPFSARR